MGLFSFAESKKFLGLSSASSKGPRFLDVHSIPSAPGPSSPHDCTGYPGRLSRAAIQGGYPGWLSRVAIQGKRPPQFAFPLYIQLQLQPGSSLHCITGRRLQAPGISS